MGVFRKLGSAVGKVTGSETGKYYGKAAHNVKERVGGTVGPRLHQFAENQRVKAKEKKDQRIREDAIYHQAYQEGREKTIRKEARRKAAMDVRGGSGGTIGRVENFFGAVDRGFGALNGPASNFSNMMDPFASQPRHQAPRKPQKKHKTRRR